MTEAYKQLKQRADASWDSLTKGSPARIFVGTATCGRAAGGLQVVEAFEKAIAESGVEARVHKVGCIGLCYAEVLVDIIAPGRPALLTRTLPRRLLKPWSRTTWSVETRGPTSLWPSAAMSR